MYYQRYRLYKGYGQIYMLHNKYSITENVVTGVCSEKCEVFKVTTIIKWQIRKLITQYSTGTNLILVNQIYYNH